MLVVTNDFAAGRSTWWNVMDSIEFLTNQVEARRDEWVQNIRKHWEVMEEVRAVMLAQEPISFRLSEKDLGLIQEAIDGTRAILENVLATDT